LYDLVEKALKQPDNDELQKMAGMSKALLEKAANDEAEFAAAVRCAIRSRFQYVSD
jgi:hypothetical protein